MVFILQGFVSGKECSELITYAEDIGFKEAIVAFPEGEQLAKNIRNNDRIAYKDNGFAERMFLRAKDFLPAVIDGYELNGFSEMVRFYRYTAGQRFKKHKDGSYKQSEEAESRLSFLVYLNQDCVGGETIIHDDDCEHVIKPETGTALIFPHDLWHEGSSIISGKKYVLRFDVVYGKN